jgi:uncharacterized membrane protein YdfJ with MMPL/SSD domain
LQEKVGEVLKRTGVSVILPVLCKIAAFVAAAIIPIPALRSLALQAALLCAFNALSMMLLFPALIGLDLKRVDKKKIDILCCYRYVLIAFKKFKNLKKIKN